MYTQVERSVTKEGNLRPSVRLLYLGFDISLITLFCKHYFNQGFRRLYSMLFRFDLINCLAYLSSVYKEIDPHHANSKHLSIELVQPSE